LMLWHLKQPLAITTFLPAAWGPVSVSKGTGGGPGGGPGVVVGAVRMQPSARHTRPSAGSPRNTRRRPLITGPFTKGGQKMTGSPDSILARGKKQPASVIGEMAESAAAQVGLDHDLGRVQVGPGFRAEGVNRLDLAAGVGKPPHRRGELVRGQPSGI